MIFTERELLAVARGEVAHYKRQRDEARSELAALKVGKRITVSITGYADKLTLSVLRLQLGQEIRARKAAERAVRLKDNEMDCLIAATREAGCTSEAQIEALREALALRKEMHHETLEALDCSRAAQLQLARELGERMTENDLLLRQRDGARLALRACVQNGTAILTMLPKETR